MACRSKARYLRVDKLGGLEFFCRYRDLIFWVPAIGETLPRGWKVAGGVDLCGGVCRYYRRGNRLNSQWALTEERNSRRFFVSFCRELTKRLVKV